MSDIKTDYLVLLQKKQEITHTLLAGAKKIQDGGTAGIVYVAQEQPEMILAAIAGLSTIIEQMQIEHLALVEDYFALVDSIDKINPNS